VESLLSSPSKAGRKLGKWAAKGKARRLSRLLSRASTTACKQLLRARDSYGLTPLHNACAHGHTEAVLALLQ
jgi:ankyrin repeat protein